MENTFFWPKKSSVLIKLWLKLNNNFIFDIMLSNGSYTYGYEKNGAIFLLEESITNNEKLFSDMKN